MAFAFEILESRKLFSAGTLDQHWLESDIGAPPLAGDASSTQVTRTNLVFAISGSGDGVSTTVDSMHFVYQTLWGAGKIIAHIGVESATADPAAEVGVMIRESLAPGARTVSVGLTPATTAVFSNRILTDESAIVTPLATAKPPQWVKLVRSGSTFTSFVSNNRSNWKRVSVTKISMTINTLIGLWVSSNDTAQLESASIDNVQTSSQTPNTRSPAWQTAAIAPITLSEAASATVNGKLYVFGGFYTIDTKTTAQCDVYDPATNGWTRLADMPYAFTHAGVAVVGTDVYFAGGFLGDWHGPTLTDQTAAVLKYDTLTDTWSTIASLPASRAAGGLVLVGNQLHFFGGTDEFVQHDMPDHWVFDLTNPEAGWITKAPMPNARDHFGYTTLNGLIYAIGGEYLTDEIAGNTNEVDVYDPTTDSWKTVAPLPLAQSHIHTNTLVINNRIVIFGGSTNGTTQATVLSSIYSYNFKRNRWSTVKPILPEPRAAVVARVVGNEIIVTGGENDFLPESTTWVLDQTIFARQLSG